MLTCVVATTALVVMEKSALGEPAGHSTVPPAGTRAAGSLLDRFTVTPPKGAAKFSVTVPIDVCVPVTVAGLTEIDCRTADEAAGAMMLAHQVPQLLRVVCGPAYSCTVQKSVSFIGSTWV